VNREAWDERYATEELIWKADPNRFLVEEADGLEPGRALDVACGEGRNAVWLASKGWPVTGVDFSHAGLAKVERLAPERGVEVTWVEADVVVWRPPPACFDLVIVMYLHMVAGHRRHILANAALGAVDRHVNSGLDGVHARPFPIDARVRRAS
jgi:2-polyprenyl-3-methyl-5-hydroxy-6-metoxy-1,4-benzoquinol methylase